MKKTIIVDIDGQKITVEKLPLGKYAELLKAIKELPKHVDKLKKMDSQEGLEMLPALIGDSLPDFINILAIATPLSTEEIDLLGLDDAVKLVLAVVEVNNYQEIYRMAKKALAPQSPAA
jgi:hypothetical protein